jgi:CHAD domain-containing protein
MVPSTPRHALFLRRLRRFTRTLPGVEAGDARAVHRMRVASRRLRELLPVLQLERQSSGRLPRRLRKVTRRLGGVRELDVVALEVAELRRQEPGCAKALDVLEQEARQARDRAHERLVQSGAARELRRIAGKLETAAARVRDDRSPLARRRWIWAVEARVARRAALLRLAIDEAGSVYLAERLHAVRIALKKVRYGVELLWEGTGRAARRADLVRLRHDQDLLGHLHDLHVLIERVRRAQTSLAPPDLTVWRDLERISALLEARCRRLHAQYVRRRPALAGLCDRLSARAMDVGAARRAG